MEAVITRRRCNGCGKVEESAEEPVFGGRDFVGWLTLEGVGQRCPWRKHFCGAVCLHRQSLESLAAPPVGALTSIQLALGKELLRAKPGV